MKPPQMFECPACDKKHYVVYCAAGAEDQPCEDRYVSAYYPSPKDSLCPRHRYPNDPDKGGVLMPDHLMTYDIMASYQFDPAMLLRFAVDLLEKRK